MESLIERQATYWSTAEVFDSSTRKQVSALIESNDVEQLSEMFYRDLDFGTGGLRGVVGVGTSRINIYNVRKATCALARHLKKKFPDESLKLSVSFDSRNYSREFAVAVAEVAAAHDIKTYVTKELRPVPMLSYMVRHFSCHAGVCITASHNPPEYNGYKVYCQTGGQLVPPDDQNIIREYSAISDYGEIPFLDWDQGIQAGLIVEVSEELDGAYFGAVEKLSNYAGGRDKVKIVYTPLHGSGNFPVVEALRRFGFNQVQVVPEQAQPDGDFPTVASPNPEDPQALEMAVALADISDANIVLGTDPDADRVGIVVKEKGKWVWLNGNQLGCLLIDFVLKSLKNSGKLPESPLVVKTIVTTELQRHIAVSYGASCEDTLTGFKWICDLIDQYESGKKTPYKKYVCGGEESYGFLADTFVRDKDAVISCCLAAEMLAWHLDQGRTLTDALDDLFKQHGVYQEGLHTETLPGQDGAKLIQSLMTTIRDKPPLELAGAQIDAVMDFQLGRQYIRKNNSYMPSAEITLPQSNVLQFILEDGSKVSVRPSGTEPKIKFYFSANMLVPDSCSQVELESIKVRCLNRVEQLKEAMIALVPK